MKVSASTINWFVAFKLPSAFLCGVRVKDLRLTACTTTVTHRWINQNPFQSLYFAVQAMAAELSTGALLVVKIKESGFEIGMLVTHFEATYTKKAVGKITFECVDGLKVAQTIHNAKETKERQTVSLKSIGTDSNGAVVSEFIFQWSVKVKKS